MKLVYEEWRLFCVQTHEPGFWVLHADFVQVHVYDLAPLKVLMEECHADKPSFGHNRQEFALSYLLVGAVTQSFVVLLFFVLLFHSGHSGLFIASHDLLRLFIHEIVELIIDVGTLFLFFLLFVHLAVHCHIFRGHHLFLDHRSLVFDGLLDNHVCENAAC